MVLRLGDTVAIVCCSDGHRPERLEENQQLDQTIRTLGLVPVWSPYIYAEQSVFSGTGKERAKAVNRFYRDPAIRAIFDISGGNVGNNVLEYLDYDAICRDPKPFFGYSDLTTVLHAIYTKTGGPGCLYQLRNLTGANGALQQERFRDSILGNGSALFDGAYTFLRGSSISGTVVGGNLRCLLKLAGTPYWPDCTGKVLFLESLGGGLGEIAAMAVQLRQMGVFSQIAGLLLGTFTKLEAVESSTAPAEIFLRAAAQFTFPIAKTKEIGHGDDSKALWIGQPIAIQE